jgi:HlyD family secretion protein
VSSITLPTPFSWRLPRWLALLGGLLLGAALIAAIALRSRGTVSYVTAPVVQQTLTQSVTASGTVNPQNAVSVGTQVSGTIQSISVDYNRTVRKGQVLARLDPSTFQAQLDQAQAALSQAQALAAQADAAASGAQSGVAIAGANSAAQEAAVASAQANVDKAQATLRLAQQTQTRDSALLAQGYIAQSSVDTDRSNTAQDEAAVAAAQAAVAQARAQAAASSETVGQIGDSAQAQAAAAQAAQAGVEAALAAVQQDRLNLEHTVIASPVDGTVVAREVSVGQTVAPSLQTPTLFSIAQNLQKMEVDINVGEPDIGNVKAGDPVSFSVLAYPNRTFRGTVSQVRINPQTVNNVVTYDVVVLAGNADGALLPGMTANATIDVAKAPNALVVPAAALQWQPQRAGRGRAAGATASSPWGAVNGQSATTPIASGSSG